MRQMLRPYGKFTVISQKARKFIMSLSVGEIIQVKVESLNYSANSVCRIDKFVVFVPYGTPEDTLLVKIV